MTQAKDLNDLLPVTPSMERFTKQASALSDAIENFKLNPRPFMRSSLIIFINNFMDNNEHDELGNWHDLADIVGRELKAKI